MRRRNSLWNSSNLRQRSSFRHRRRGMTLLEVLVAVSVVVVMALTVAESLRNSIEFNVLLNDRDTITRQARVALSKIRRDIQLAFLTPHQTAAENFLTVFVGIDSEPDSVFFATLAHQRIYRDSRECDQAEVTIWTERSPEGEGYTLYHRESPRIDEEPDEGGAIYPLAYNVRTFSLRYLDAQTQEWVEEWDTRSAVTPYRLPRAVEVGLVLLAPDPEDPERTVDVPFISTVMLQYGERLPSANNPFGGLSPLAGNPGIQPMVNPAPTGRPGRGGANGPRGVPTGVTEDGMPVIPVRR